MTRRFLLMLFAAGLAVAPAFARSFAEDVVGQLTRQGFTGIATESTWLGRIRIIAHRNGGTREIVLNPRTGEILRDIWTPADASIGQVPIVDDIRDDHGGDDQGDDSSGHGGGDDDGGNSGSDNSGHGSGDDSGGDDHGGKGKD